jgi:hypothetical protein
MKDADRKALRLFYRTLASESGAITQKQVDFYRMVLRGDHDARRAWMAAYIKEATYLDLSVLGLLQSSEVLTKEDIAFIAASAIAPKLPGFLSRLWKKLTGWLG